MKNIQKNAEMLNRISNKTRLSFYHTSFPYKHHILKALYHNKDFNMPTPRSIGFDLKFQTSGYNTSRQRKLVVLAGWLGAKERQMKSYLSFYHKSGFDTLYFAVGPLQVLYPDRAYSQMERVLDAATGKGLVIDAFPQGEILDIESLIFHHFSVGGFLYGQALRAIADQPDRFSKTKQLIRAQIFDSPPDIRGIPAGLARSLGVGSPIDKIIEYSVRAFLKFNESTSGAGYKASSNAFHSNSVPAPSLWFYSKGDPVADWQDCAAVIEKWRAKGIEVEECVWSDTPHIQHARLDPDRYFGTLASFLRKNCLLTN